MSYIHLHPKWPGFYWDMNRLGGLLANLRYKQDCLAGQMGMLDLKFQTKATFEALTSELIMSSTIEGEILNLEDVRASLARRLGLDLALANPVNRHVEALVEMLLDATSNQTAPLTCARLYGWQVALCSSGYSGLQIIKSGSFRSEESGPMQVLSGPFGHEKIHFEAPAALRVPGEMEKFLEWFNEKITEERVLKAGVAHLWFLTIHPFEYGNGRIARALTDLLLMQGEPGYFYSFSRQIEQERRAYYKALGLAQNASLDITDWLEWFIGCLTRAVAGAEVSLALVLRKAQVWREVGQYPLNDRQRLMINKLMDNFAGNLSSSKYGKIAKCSPDTALLDLQQLVNWGILKASQGGGRSRHYLLVL